MSDDTSRPETGEFLGNPWEGVEMPEGFDPTSNPFLNDVVIRLTSEAEFLISRTQDEWVEWFKDYKGVFLPSVADLYHEFARIGDSLPASQTIRDRLLSTISGSCYHTSTRIEFSDSDLGARIIHNYGSRNPIVKEVIVPNYVGDFLVKNGPNPEIVAYLQALFNTNHSFSKMIDVLRGGSKAGRELGSHIPHLSDRKELGACAMRWQHVGNDDDVRVLYSEVDYKEPALAMKADPEIKIIQAKGYHLPYMGDAVDTFYFEADREALPECVLDTDLFGVLDRMAGADTDIRQKTKKIWAAYSGSASPIKPYLRDANGAFVRLIGPDGNLKNQDASISEEPMRWAGIAVRPDLAPRVTALLQRRGYNVIDTGAKYDEPFEDMK